MVLKKSSALHTIIGAEIWFFPILESGFKKTEELLRLYPRTANGRVLIAGEIVNAKGRFQRKWYAEKGGLWCTITLYDELLEENKGLLSLIWGLSIVRALRDLGIGEAFVKWINDVHVNCRKIAGVLQENLGEWIIVGLGINVNNDLPKDLPAISVKSLIGCEISLNSLLTKLLEWVNHYYNLLWHLEKDPIDELHQNPIISDMKNFSDTLNRCVYYSYNLDIPDNGVFGVTKDFTARGGLLLQTDEALLELYAGEIIYL